MPDLRTASPDLAYAYKDNIINPQVQALDEKGATTQANAVKAAIEARAAAEVQNRIPALTVTGATIKRGR